MRRLFIRPGAIGDFIVSLPAMESLRADYTEVWCSSATLPLSRFAHRTRSIAAVGLDRLGILPADDVIARLRDFDDIVSWYGANRPEFRAHTAKLGLPFRFCQALPAGVHAVEFYNRQAREIGGKPARQPRLDVPAVERRFAAIHPFASSARKQAPMPWFQAMAKRLEQRMPVEWLTYPYPIPDLYELACWLAGARVYLGNDSGISHLAAAVGTPVVSVFQSSHSRMWSPCGLGWAIGKSVENISGSSN